MNDTRPVMDPRAAAKIRAVASVNYEEQRIEKERAERARLVNLMFLINHLEGPNMRCSKAKVAEWHHDTADALGHPVTSLPRVHELGTPALQKRLCIEIQTLAKRLMVEKRWEARA